MRALVAPAFVAFLVLGAPACGHQSAEDRQLAGLQEEVTRMEAERDRVDARLSALEVDGADPKNGRGPPRPLRKAPPPVPTQRVVQLDPDGSEQAQASSEAAGSLNGDDPEDATPRPSIRIVGSPSPRSSRGRNSRAGDTKAEDVMTGGTIDPPTGPRGAGPTAIDPQAARAYDAALALVNARQYDKALEAFAAFLVKWPDHPYADNAMYWRGECYFAKGDYPRAAEEFAGTVARFPVGNKVPDALLKQGLCQDKLGNPAKARGYYDRLTREYPRSEAARRLTAGGGTKARSVGPEESP